MANGTGPAVADTLARGPEVGLGNGLLTIRSFKVVLDGALGSRGAQFAAPYADAAAERGLETMTDRRSTRSSPLGRTLPVGAFASNTHPSSTPRIGRASPGWA
jgi:hypothetical protein